VENINELYHRALQGDNTAEQQLFRHLTVIFRMFIRQRGAGHPDLEDIVQSAMMKVAREYRRTPINSSFGSWAQTVLKNTFIDSCRRESMRRSKLAILASEHRTSSRPLPDPTLKARLKGCLRKVHEINPLHARVVNLHYQGFTAAEICDRLHITVNHLRVSLFRARAVLRTCLKESENDRE